jgi:hypothetical protein
MLVVQPPPAGQHLLDPELETAGRLGGGGRAALLDELPVDDLAERSQALDLVGLHGAPSAVAYRDEEYAELVHGSPGHRAERAATGPPTVGTCTG